MKKLLFTVLAAIIYPGLVSAQIPNGGFEDWVAIENYESPVNWGTNQDTFYTRLVKDTFAV